MLRSLRTRVILLIVAAVTVCLFFFFFLEISINTKLYSAQMEKEILVSVKMSIEKVDHYTHVMEQKSTDLARTGEFFYTLRKDSPKKNLDAEMEKYLTENFSTFREAIGGGIWYEPYKFSADKQYYGPYAFWNKEKVIFTWDLTAPEYDYLTQDWYTIALPPDWSRSKKRAQDHYWTAPYYDEAGTFQLMITVDAFMYDEKGMIIGITTADWSIEKMVNFLRESKITEDSGIFLVEGGSNMVMTNTLAPESVMKDANTVPWMKLLVSPEKGNIKETAVSIGGTSYYAYYALTDAGMLYGTLVPHHVLSDPANKLLTISIGMSIFFGVLLIIVLYFILSTVTNPIIALTKVVTRVAGGDLSSQIKISSEDEIGQLATSFNSMTQKLAEMYANLDEKVKEKTSQLTQQIHETKMHAEELRKFQLAVENTSQHIIITDRDGTVLYANPAVASTTGFAREEVIGNNPSLWGKQMSKEFYEQLWHTILVEKKTFTGEVQNKRKNGEHYIALAIISPIVDNTGEVKFFIGIETDITRQKEFEKMLADEKDHVDKLVIERTRELKQEHARLLSSINSLSFGFIVADTEDRIILKNKAMSQLFEFREGDVLSIERISSLLGEHFDLRMRVEQCFRDKAACEIKEIVFGKRFLRGIIAPVMTEDNMEKLGYVLLLEDITEAKVMERSRDEFFAVASHELRTPLTAIRGNADMLLDLPADQKIDADMRGMLSDINASSIRLIEIVNDFLEVSRLEQGKFNMKKECFPAVLVVEKVVRDLGEMIGKKGISLRFAPPSSPLPDVLADKDRFEQVLLNLVGNSAKFTKEGSVTIELEQQDKFIKVRVTDTGIGISQQNQTLLFRKFQQAGESVLARDIAQGTGLGLYICKIIVNAMGGEIGIERSELDKGSTFFFTLPIS